MSDTWPKFMAPTPCLRCGELLTAGDAVSFYANGPAHYACYMRGILGSVAHIERRCSCFVPGADDNDDPYLTPRQAAQAALDAWLKQQESPDE